MPKSDLTSSVERIAERTAKRILRESTLFTSTGTWAKTLQDENRVLKRRIEELEIRVKKLNNHGPTILKSAQNGSDTVVSSQAELPRLSLMQIRKIRTGHGFSQEQFSQLLEVSCVRYRKWESGRVAIPLEYEQKIREIRNLKGLELRTRMLNVGIFQPAGRVGVVSKKPITLAVKTTPKARAKQAHAKSVSGEELKNLRAKLGLTQKEFSEKLGIHKDRYKMWEQGRVKTPVEFMPKIRALSLQNAQDENPSLPIKTTVDIPRSTQTVSAARLREIRAKLGLTRREIADILKIKKSRYANWERGLVKAAPEFVTAMLKLLAEKRETSQSEGNGASVKLTEFPNSADIPSVISTEQLRKIRATLRLTQKQIAEILGIKESRYTNWECGYGKPSPDFVKRILALQPDLVVTPSAKQNPDDEHAVNEKSQDDKTAQQIVDKENCNTVSATNLMKLLDLNNIPVTLSSGQLREIRTALKLSHRQIAGKLEINEKRYGNWEYGRVSPSSDFVKRILKLLAEAMSTFLGAEQYTVWKQVPVEAPLPKQALLPRTMRKIRKNLNLTHSQIAEAIGVTMHRYKAWEYGDVRPPLEFCRKLQDLARGKR